MQHQAIHSQRSIVLAQGHGIYKGSRMVAHNTLRVVQQWRRVAGQILWWCGNQTLNVRGHQVRIHFSGVSQFDFLRGRMTTHVPSTKDMGVALNL